MTKKKLRTDCRGCYKEAITAEVGGSRRSLLTAGASVFAGQPYHGGMGFLSRYQRSEE